MKFVVILVLLVGVGVLVLRMKRSSSEESFNPKMQGAEAHATTEGCKNWTEVLDRVGEPRKWRSATSDFDFNYIDRFDSTTRDLIAGRLEKNELSGGFSFFYRYSDSFTFAVNFDGKGAFSNIQDKEGKASLMDSAGG